MKNTVEYKLIASHYSNRVAKRSQVPLINHINEGLVVLDAIKASDHAKRAFCMHPLWQADADLKENYYMASFVEPHVTTLTMEYRSVANEFLSNKMEGLQPVIEAYGIEGLNPGLVRLSPLLEVNDMLIADKVQNYKDFVTYHKKTHERTSELDDYFKIWLHRLGVDSTMYANLCKAIDASKT